MQVDTERHEHQQIHQRLISSLISDNRLHRTEQVATQCARFPSDVADKSKRYQLKPGAGQLGNIFPTGQGHDN